MFKSCVHPTCIFRSSVVTVMFYLKGYHNIQVLWSAARRRYCTTPASLLPKYSSLYSFRLACLKQTLNSIEAAIVLRIQAYSSGGRNLAVVGHLGSTFSLVFVLLRRLLQKLETTRLGAESWKPHVRTRVNPCSLSICWMAVKFCCLLNLWRRLCAVSTTLLLVRYCFKTGT